MGYSFFSVVYFRRGTLPKKRVKLSITHPQNQKLNHNMKHQGHVSSWTVQKLSFTPSQHRPKNGRFNHQPQMATDPISHGQHSLYPQLTLESVGNPAHNSNLVKLTRVISLLSGVFIHVRNVRNGTWCWTGPGSFWLSMNTDPFARQAQQHQKPTTA